MNEEYGKNKPLQKTKQTYKEGLPTPVVDITPKQIKRVLEKIAADQVTHNESLIAALNTNFDLLTKELTKITADSSKESQVLKTELYENVAALQAKLISTLEANKIEIPQELKVEVTNPPIIEKVTFPEVQKVEITNKEKVQKVEVTNPQKPTEIPIGVGDKPGKADPTKYIPVRLTNGSRFYNALAEAYVAASKSVFPFVNYKSGKPQAAAVDNDGTLRVDVEVSVPPVTISGIENVTTISGSVVTTISGSQTDIKNFPTVQTVNVQNQPLLVSGMDNVTVSNFPSVQTVSVKDMPQINVDIKLDEVTLAVSGMVTTLSGSKTDVQNWPTIQTVNVQNLTTISGQQNFHIDNFPTVQSVNVLNQRTLASGVDNVTVTNFPTIQTVNVQNQRTLTSGVDNVGITNWPTVQTVAVQSMPQINVDLKVDDVTLAVSGTITTLSGSKTDVQNFPTIQTVNVQNLTTISGQQNFHVDNWPTYQSVNVSSIVPLTSISGMFHSLVDNFPTIQTVRDNSLTISGSQHTLIDNFPTVQKVSIQDIPTVTAQLVADGVTMAVSGTVTTLSGSQTDIKNWPTYQTVNVANIVSLTSISGMFHTVIDNFPTIQTVNVTGSVTSRKEDDPHTSGDSGTFILGVRNDAGTDLTSNDLDYTAFATDSAGRIKQSPSTTSLANGAETTVSGIASQVIAANTARKGLIVQNTGVANARIGITGVTATTGVRLTPGGTITFTAPFIVTNAIFAIREGAISTIVMAQEIT